MESYKKLSQEGRKKNQAYGVFLGQIGGERQR